jgi:hypothetical protein
MFKFLKRTKPIILGRWSVTYDKRVLDKRINWANHDHCGSEICEKKFDYSEKEKVKKNVRGDEQDMEYYLPYCL